MKTWAISVAAVGLAGCASMFDPTIQARLENKTPDQPVACMACTTEWQRAQLWLAQHAKWRLQSISDVVLATFAPVGQDPSFGFQVLKMPLPGGGYAITMNLSCGNALGCDPTAPSVRRAFYHYVLTGEDALLGLGYMGSVR